MTQKKMNIALEDRVLASEPAYENMEERRIGRMLDLYGIPFFYHEGRMIYDQGRYHIETPGFTLPGYEGLIVDYAENSQASNREQLYQANGIPAIVVSSQDLVRQNWPDELYHKIAQATLAQSNYSPRDMYKQ